MNVCHNTANEESALKHMSGKESQKAMTKWISLNKMNKTKSRDITTYKLGPIGLCLMFG